MRRSLLGLALLLAAAPRLCAAPRGNDCRQQRFKKIISAVKPLGPTTPGSEPSRDRAIEVTFANGLSLVSDPARHEVRIDFPTGASITLNKTSLEVQSRSVTLRGARDYSDSDGQPRRRELRQVIRDEAACRLPEGKRLISTGLWLMSLQAQDEALGGSDGEPLDPKKGPLVVVALRGDSDTWGDRGTVREGSSGDYRLFSGELIYPLLYRRWLVNPHPAPGFNQTLGPQAEQRISAVLNEPRPF